MERVLGILLDRLDYARFEPIFLYFRSLPEQESGSYLAGILKKRGIRTYYRPYERGLSLLKMAPRIREVVAKEGPDVIMANEWFQVAAGAKAASGMKDPPRLVGVIHNNVVREFSGGKGLRLMKGLYGSYLRRADPLVCVSRGVADSMRSYFRISKKNIAVIRNCFDTGLIGGKGRLRRKENVILGVGRLSEQKDWPCLFRAFQLVRKRADAQLWVVGGGGLMPGLEDLARELGIRDHVKFFGHKSSPYEYMKKAAVFCLSSVHEGFPVVLQEAMACGCPVVATDCPFGPDEIINDGQNGYLVPVGDFEEMADRLLKLLDDPELRQKLAKNGLNKVKMDFSPEKMVSAYERLFSR